MALKSMTGFGRSEAASAGLRAEVELSSVNRKQLDVQVCLPRGLTVLESKITQDVGKVFSRGCITVSVKLSGTGRAKESLSVDEDLATACVSALRRVAKKLKLKDDLSAQVLTHLPDVIKTRQPEVDADVVWPVVKTAIGKAQTNLAKMRAAEGAKLQQDISARLKLLRDLRGQINKLAGSVTAKYREALLVRIKAAGFNVAADDPQMRKELVFFADRCDISEELTRLESHFGQATKLLGSSQPVGRPMDFLIQEMFREITTIGSKANNAEISSHVVMFKTELERMREQVQNVE
ncbi:MAG: YicC/YloC family endoribonuclease [bacterium]